MDGNYLDRTARVSIMSWSNLLMSGEPLKSLDVATSCLYKMAFSGTKYATQWCGPPMLMNDSNI